MSEPRSHSDELLAPGTTVPELDHAVAGAVLERKIRRGWIFGFFIAFSLLMLLLASIGWLFIKGVGIWGINVPVAWGFAIINFVWWIGIGHAGTFISAILLLLHQQWRTSINRFTEAMTLFAVACAGLFPILHLGRPEYCYWLTPYPNTMGLWPQWRSPLVWDVFAVSTYATVSLVFWYIGLVPDLGVLRDRAFQQGKIFRAKIFGIFSLGWRGSAKHWEHYHRVYLILGGLAAPLVISVHSIVGMDFAVGIVPGWHSTIFPPFFVAGAIYSGFAMVLTLLIPVRAIYGLKPFITDNHLDKAAKVMLATGTMVWFGYYCELFMAWYSGDGFERFLVWNRAAGPYAPAYWMLILCNTIIIQALWFKWVRHHVVALFIISIFANIGMWLERYVIVVVSLHRDFLPSSWGSYHGTRWDWATFAGTFGLFFTLLFLFIRLIPMISITEMREFITEKRKEDP
ncbi:polysulfide reductase NrfD [Luteolibacter pohnpeiensis]|uniref:Polysulfide reductase NrfD n=1 Tax=Luteolibacter pohnpeiensis TaxID=454153 RepID=A0A934VU17_9BACT|nr:NrfD/PsrC family molybdoenzyme membrane anchor subunit [Luteolibacter pohnpeiensis]MBK1882067.1 polysulfide reductase NrfD [Luteolibacter pohnpeiensis]